MPYHTIPPSRRGARELMRKPRPLAVIRNRRLNSVALLVPLRSVQFRPCHTIPDITIPAVLLFDVNITFTVQFSSVQFTLCCTIPPLCTSQASVIAVQVCVPCPCRPTLPTPVCATRSKSTSTCPPWAARHPLRCWRPSSR